MASLVVSVMFGEVANANNESGKDVGREKEPEHRVGFDGPYLQGYYAQKFAGIEVIFNNSNW